MESDGALSLLCNACMALSHYACPGCAPHLMGVSFATAEEPAEEDGADKLVKPAEDKEAVAAVAELPSNATSAPDQGMLTLPMLASTIQWLGGCP